MLLNKKIAILGGDARQIALAEKMAELGFTVRCFGLPLRERTAKIVACDEWKAAVEGATTVILPLPASPDGRYLSLPLEKEKESPFLNDILEAVSHKSVLVGGKLPTSVLTLAKEKGIQVFDFCQSELFLQKNALPTAEAAVMILMREMPRTVSGLSVGVTGFGRVAMALTRLLTAMGAEVTVAARRQEALDAAAAEGCATVLLTKEEFLENFAQKQAVIFNTVPHWIFSEEILSKMEAKTLIVDLASAPGGVDSSAAAAHAIKVIWALSLPGKYAPVTAGEIIAETVLSYMKGEKHL